MLRGAAGRVVPPHLHMAYFPDLWSCLAPGLLLASSAAAAAAAELLVLHRSLISSRPSLRALTNTAELVPVFSQKLDTQKMMWSDCGL